MIELKKRNSTLINNNEYNRNRRKRRVPHGLVIYRILCPVGVTGCVIGKSRKVVTSVRLITKAKIKFADPLPGCSQRVIKIFCSVKDKKEEKEVEKYEEIDISKPLCCAQEALLKLHDAIASYGDHNKLGRVDKKECRLLVPSNQTASVIGKSGCNIKKVRSRSGASVRFESFDDSDPSHACATPFDCILVISGEPESVKKALFAVSAIMYRTNPGEQIPLHSNIQDFEGYEETTMPDFD